MHPALVQVNQVTAAARRPAVHPGPVAAAATPGLNALRLAAMTCRASARLGLVEGLNREAPDLTVLARILPALLGYAPRFHRPGTAEVSFDEAWIMSVMDAAQRRDGDSLVFLLSRRVAGVWRMEFARFLRRL